MSAAKQRAVRRANAAQDCAKHDPHKPHKVTLNSGDMTVYAVFRGLWSFNWWYGGVIITKAEAIKILTRDGERP